MQHYGKLSKRVQGGGDISPARPSYPLAGGDLPKIGNGGWHKRTGPSRLSFGSLARWNEL